MVTTAMGPERRGRAFDHAVLGVQNESTGKIVDEPMDEEKAATIGDHVEGRGNAHGAPTNGHTNGTTDATREKI
jgi:hypothetical protein